MTNLAIIGCGNMGQYTAKALEPKVESIKVFDPNIPRETLEKSLQGIPSSIADNYRDAVRNADAVMFCVPYNLVSEAMQNTLPFCKKGTLISGQTSRKTPEAEAFDRYISKNPGADLEFVTVHTMCNPSKSDPSKEILGIIRHNSSDSAYERAFQLYGGMSEHIEEFASVEEHDIMTANTQINTSRTFLSIASAFAEAGCFPWINGSYGSSLDIMKFSLAMRSATLPGHVYRGIQFGSKHGKDIVSKAIDVEKELFMNIVGDCRGDYSKRVLSAKEVLFGTERLDPILSPESIKQFNKGGIVKPNSHFAIIQYAVAFAERGRNPFDDLKATTPMYTSLLCLMDYVFNSEDLLEQAIAAPFEIPSIRSDDLVFHDEVKGWANVLLFDNTQEYDHKHKRMCLKLEDYDRDEQIELSKDIVKLCRESMDKRKT
jgi:prephenate dehydrogenase (NADP+)